ncbi:MAG: NAD(P)/FAD-dependent oxidoreductase [Anaerolineae bacterium]|nr:NAD(P)/FAD-dependent oxidoreductase [Anaerolineae bacterium]
MALNETPQDRKRVVVVGAGFGGLTCARKLSGHGLEIVLVDRNNYTLFQPLLYQVGTAALHREAIAEPVRHIIQDNRDIQFVLAEVQSVDLTQCQIATTVGPIAYDYLVLAAGAVPNFFGNKSIRETAFALKTLSDAGRLRNQILTVFEEASVETDEARREQFLTFVIVGGGPIGVELSGALAELVQNVMLKDYHDLRIGDVKIILLEAGDALMKPYPRSLQDYTLKRLQKLGVEVRLNVRVQGSDETGVVLADGSHIPAHTLVWGTGTRAAELTDHVDAPKGRGGLIQVGSDFSLLNHPEVFAIGDFADYMFEGSPLPGLAQPAIQGGEYVAEVITKVREQGQTIAPFSYWDKGTMAVIGRGAAIASVPRPQPYHADRHRGKEQRFLNLHGFPAWSAWLGLHLTYLGGFRNRMVAALDWSWDYVRNENQDRLITAVRQKEAESDDE